MDDVIETRGNLDFIEILNSYPEFVEGVKGFEKKKRGRSTDNPSPEEVEYLVHIVESLYIEKGKILFTFMILCDIMSVYVHATLFVY